MSAAAFSAFGSTKPIHDVSGERIRWFCPRLISSPDGLAHAIREVEILARQTEVSRLTLRIISPFPLNDESLALLGEYGFRVEAMIPLTSPEPLVMSYIGKCRQERRSLPEDRTKERQMLEDIMSGPRSGAANLDRYFASLEDFQIEAVHSGSLSSSDMDCLISLHHKTFPVFPYDFATKLEIMLDNPANYLPVLVRSSRNGKICAFSNLEMNRVVLDSGLEISLAEYDNSMRITSSSEHSRIKGIGAALRLYLARKASELGVDLCHSESRAGLASINSISYHMGMHFGGTLEQHLLISGQSDVRYNAPSRYESMNVWYLNREQLKDLSQAG